VPVRPVRPLELRGKLFRASHVISAGLLTRSQLRSSAWRRVFPDVWACASLPLTHRLRALAAARLLLPGAVVSGRSAAVLWEAPLADEGDDVEVTVPPSFRGGSIPGIRLRRRALPDHDVVVRQGTRVTGRIRTALDLAEIRPLDDAVIAVDAFLVATRRPVGEVRAAAATGTGRHCRHVRRVLALADGLAGSPQETRLRLLLGRSDVPTPVAQHRVLEDGQFLARVDFAWPEHRLALEYEGTWHGAPQQVPEDRERLNRLFAAGWRVIFVTKDDLRRPERLLSRIRAGLSAPTFA
jgi:hypothetical protein